MTEAIRSWDCDAGFDPGENVDEFLRRLAGPAWLHLHGRDSRRRRAITTLIHGNEPSGVRAVHAYLAAGRRPVTDTVVLIASVAAAREAAGFSHRMLPGHRDLNRCFLPPYADGQGHLAREILARLRAAQPEALVDLHNTSGAGPAYGVGIRADAASLALTAMFASHYILTDIRLGALMEATAADFPTVTREGGGVGGGAADAVAAAGLDRFLDRDRLFEACGEDVTVLEHPIRVGIAPGTRLAYGATAVTGCDVTLRADIDRFNSGVLPPGEPLGWTSRLELLRAPNGRGEEQREQLFAVRDGVLHGRSALRLFMATTSARIALDDCAFYAIRC